MVFIETYSCSSTYVTNLRMGKQVKVDLDDSSMPGLQLIDYTFNLLLATKRKYAHQTRRTQNYHLEKMVHILFHH